MTATGSLRICLIASSRFPVREPFAGGLEAHTHSLAHELMKRGHAVTLYARAGSDPDLGVAELGVAGFSSSAAARGDVASLPEQWMQEHHAYLALMLSLAREGADRFDVVHNNSLHYLPVAMAGALEIPVVTTLHTPPIAWLESAARLASGGTRFVAVSDALGRAWEHAVTTTTVLNGIDTDHWRLGDGGGRAIWSGRLVPEKAPHEAIDAARAAGFAIDLAGPRYDDRYFETEIAPRLGPDARWLGHLRQDELCAVVGRASVCVVTPAWEEPYGLVAAESMSCGTPVAAYARGSMPEIVDDTSGVLARPGNTSDLARAIRVASRLPRRLVRAAACRRFAVSRMVDSYEHVYRSVLRPAAAA
jgi:glycosyltransferase involved in cell wall biosynthesis